MYATYVTSGGKVRILHSLDDLKGFARKSDRVDALSTYDPLTESEIPVIYFRPRSPESDELIFIFKSPVMRLKKPKYGDKDLQDLRFIASYTKSGIKLLEAKPHELIEYEAADLDGIE